MCLLASLAVSAEVSSMKCTMSSQYLNFTQEIVVDLNNPDFLGNGPTEKGDEWEIAWSLSECEDSTSLVFDLKEYKKFRAGKNKSIYGRLTHSEPSISIETDVDCQAL